MKYFSLIFLFLLIGSFNACSLKDKSNTYKTTDSVTYKYYPLTPVETPEKILLIKE